MGANFELSVFDQWLLEKLLARCSHFQLSWTPLQDHPASFRLMRDAGSLWIQVMPEGRSGPCCTRVVEVGDVHSVIRGVRGNCSAPGSLRPRRRTEMAYHARFALLTLGSLLLGACGSLPVQPPPPSALPASQGGQAEQRRAAG